MFSPPLISNSPSIFTVGAGDVTIGAGAFGAGAPGATGASVAGITVGAAATMVTGLGGLEYLSVSAVSVRVKYTPSLLGASSL